MNVAELKVLVNSMPDYFNVGFELLDLDTAKSQIDECIGNGDSYTFCALKDCRVIELDSPEPELRFRIITAEH